MHIYFYMKKLTSFTAVSYSIFHILQKCRTILCTKYMNIVNDQLSFYS